MKTVILKMRIFLSVGIVISFGLLASSNGQELADKGALLKRKMHLQNPNNIINPAGTALEPENAEEPEYVPGELIVKLREGKTLDDIKELNTKYNVTQTEKVFKEIPGPKDVLKQLREKLVKVDTEHESWYWQMDRDSQEYKDYIAKIEREKQKLKEEVEAQEKFVENLEARQKVTQKDAKPTNLDNIYVLTADPKTNITSMIADYQTSPAVEYAQPNHLYKPFAFPTDALPNDTYVDPELDSSWSTGAWGQGYEDMWGLKKIEADKAWAISQGEGVVVAVIDSGVDYNHEDIADNIYRNADGTVIGYDFGAIIDSDNNGEWDLGEESNPDTDPLDDEITGGHGSHVAGTIAAIGNNGKGIIGVAPSAKIMPIKIFPYATDTVAAAAIRYAVDNGADVLSNSWGAAVPTYLQPLTKDAIDYAHAKNRVIVFAAGNNNYYAALYPPSGYKKVITVASTDHEDKKSDFSNWGPEIDVAAPGGDSKNNTLNHDYVNILSLRAEGSDMYKGADGYVEGSNIVGDKYYRSRGTSMACPHVSGIAALIISKYLELYHKGEITNEDVRQILMISTDDVDSPGFDINSGFGRINAYKALQENLPLRVQIISPDSNSLLGQTKTVTINGTAAGTGFVQYELSCARLSGLTHWLPIGSAVARQVTNGILGEWNIEELPFDTYILKLTATAVDNKRYTNMVKVNIERSGIKQITSWYSEKYSLAFSGEYIAWGDFRNGSYTDMKFNFDIYLYNLAAPLGTEAERQITNEGIQIMPSISGDKLIYEDQSLDKPSNIFLYDIKKGIEADSIVTNGVFIVDTSTISGNYIAWTDLRNESRDFESLKGINPAICDTNIYIYDISKGLEIWHTAATNAQTGAAISGEWVFWTDFRNELRSNEDLNKIQYYGSADISQYNADIYGYNITTGKEIQITSDPNYQGIVLTSGDTIYWYDKRNSKAERYYDIYSAKIADISNSVGSIYTGPVTALFTDKKNRYSLSASGSYLAWIGYANGYPQVYYYDLTKQKEEQVTVVASSKDSTAISDNRICWLDNRGRIEDIYLYQIDSSMPTTPVIDDGSYTSSITTLSAKWTDSVSDTAIKEYQYKITQDSAIGTVVKDWTSIGTTLTATATGLTLEHGRTYYFLVKAINMAGYSSLGYSDGVFVDTTSPLNPTVKISNNYGTGYISNNTTLRIDFSCSDPESGIVDYKYKVMSGLPTDSSNPLNIVRDWTTTGIKEDKGQVTITGLNLGNGKTYYVLLSAKNGAGKWGAEGYSDVVTVDITPPAKPVVTANDVYRMNFTVSWSCSDPESGIAEYQYSVGKSQGASDIRSWASAGMDTSITIRRLDVLQGPYYVNVKARNNATLIFFPMWSDIQSVKISSDMIKEDTTPPSKPVFTSPYRFTGNKRTIFEIFSTFDDESGIFAYQYIIVEGSQTLTTVVNDWVSETLLKGWSPLSELVVQGGLNLEDGKTYYIGVKAMNGANKWSEIGYSNGITVDTVSPTGTIKINNDAVYTSSDSVTLNLSASDSISGVDQMQFSNDGIAYSAAESYAVTKLWTLAEGNGAKTVYAKFKDKAGNWSIAYSDSITLDTTKPSNPSITNAAAFYGSSSTLTAGWDAASDAESGIKEYQYQINEGPTTGTVIKSWTQVAGTATSVTVSGITLEPTKTYSFSLKAVNGAGLPSDIVYNSGIKANAEPYFDSLINQYITAGALLEFTASAYDANGDILFFGTDNLPSGARFYATIQKNDPVFYGDADQNGVVNQADAYLISNYLVGKTALSDMQKLASDANGNGRVDIGDSLVISQYLSGSRKFLLGTIIYGDVNQDGNVTVDDANLIANYDVGNITLSSIQKLAADVSGDGLADIIDAMFIAQHANGLRPVFPAKNKLFFSWQTTATTPGGNYSVTLKVTDRDLTRAQAITIQIDPTPPTTPKLTLQSSWTSSTNTLSSSWSSSDPESGIAEYQYMITRDSASLAADKSNLVRDWTSTGTTASVTATGLSLQQGKTYYFSVKTKNGAGAWSGIGSFYGIKVDATAPNVPAVTVMTANGYAKYYPSIVYVKFNSTDSDSYISQYKYRVTRNSTTVAADRSNLLRDWTAVGSSASYGANITGLSLQSGRIYYFTVKAVNASKLESGLGYSIGFKADVTRPSTPSVTAVSNGYLVYPASTTYLSANWQPCLDYETGVIEYQYKITVGSPTGMIVKNWTTAGTALSVTAGVTSQPGQTFYFSVKAKNGAEVWSLEGYSNGAYDGGDGRK